MIRNYEILSTMIEKCHRKASTPIRNMSLAIVLQALTQFAAIFQLSEDFIHSRQSIKTKIPIAAVMLCKQ